MPVPVTVPIGAVAFDMDGVVIDSAPVIEAAWSAVARRHGRTLTDDDLREHVHGRPGSHTVAALFPHESPQRHREIWREVDELEETSDCAALPGVRDLVLGLAAADVAVALVTSSWPERIAHILRLHELRDAFATVVDRTQITRGKPDPEPYLTAASRLGVKPGELLVFEDSASGIRAAAAAGSPCVAIGAEAAVAEGVIATVADFGGLSLTAAADGSLALDGLGTPVRIGRSPARPGRS